MISETMPTIETVGTILKVETLTTLTESILNNTLVLENIEPFPGYHGSNLPTEPIPHYLYFILNKKYATERIIRITQSIKRYFKPEFDATAGRICIYNDQFYCVRVKDLKSFANIAELQSCYYDEGLRFMKKKNISGPALIRLNKYFILQKLEEGIFLDLEEPRMHYLQIPLQLRWKLFEKITYTIKNNFDNPNFDSALGSIFLKEVIDVLRIFAKEWNIDRLRDLRKKYLDEIARY
jgi:hypothetical protein